MEVVNGVSNGHGYRRRRRHVVALPYPGRGHINPMLDLCRRLAARGVLVTVVVTEEWLALLSSTTSSSLPAAENLCLRAIPDVIPSERHRGEDYSAFIQAVLTKMPGPVSELLRDGGLDPPVDAIVADCMLPWAAAIGKSLDVPVAALFPQAAAVFLALQEFKELEREERPSIDSVHAEGDNGALRYLPRGSSTHLADFTSSSTGQTMLKGFNQLISWSTTSARGVLLNSFDELERHAMDKLRSKIPIPIYYPGPCIPYDPMQEEGEDKDQATKEADPCTKFLDAQPDSSVLYVSLGSFLPVSGAAMEELAWGLSMSGCTFVWVVREDSTHIKEVVKETTGMVAAWCDQPRVLRHPAVGGFLTHCGWNSTLESVNAGVPMLTYPLMWDQFPNSRLIVDDWKVGFRLNHEEKEGGGGEGGGGGVVVGREEIAMAVRRLMDLNADDECKEIRRRAMELKEKSLAALMEKGSSFFALDAVVHDIINYKL